MSRKRFALAAVLLTLGAAAGCGNADDHAVTDTADAFYAAVASDDGAAACALLAPRTRSELEQSAGKPCDTAILEEDIPEAGQARRTQVFGKMGQVQYAGDTAFLAEFHSGWRMMALICAPTPKDLPYDCKVSG
ncbi:MAG TPA: hypothetical protein VFG63_11650 [Nocardioidaceae bacterium]|nr:hypothetical protein [Nocardioidaceae bacterium]